MTHIQFHSYGGGPDDEDSFSSRVADLAEYVNAHANITVDVGQILFGETTSLTGDGPLGYYLSKLYKSKWFSSDTELEAGCGICPIEYKNTSVINAWQWAIGLEWYLSVQDPWRVVMSTDHPNGGSFLAYPQIIRLLMDRTFRQDVLKTLPRQVRERCALAGLDRQYTMSEIAIITRAGPARILGLKNKGHLGPGADADVTIYTPDPNQETMFELPRFVIKAGQIIVEQGDIREETYGKTLHVAPDYDRDVEEDIQRWFEQSYSIRWRNYPVDIDQLRDHEAVG
jgi:formylmethanofuran dehydrogenase subunit A